ncbi:MAG: hypothetical protein IJW71_06700 [Clostridia bacterium]|nr:hypothetical protein [Clostridia bacterium]
MLFQKHLPASLLFLGVARTDAPITLTDGREMLLTDYASVGKMQTEESEMAVWIFTE